MARIGVAGGTGSIGRAIVDALLAPGHDTVVLSRKEDPEKSKEVGCPIVAVDYSDVDAAAKTLQKHDVHTIISALAIHTPEGETAQTTLIKAADKSAATKRFMPSEWAWPYSEKSAEIFPPHNVRRRAYLLLKNETKLEYVLVAVGFFMDYLGGPKIKSYAPMMSIVIDVEAKKAAIPGDGSQKVTFSYTHDIAKHVTKYIDLPEGQWEESITIACDKKSWKEVLEISERVTTEKFKVTYNTKEKLEAGQATELPNLAGMFTYMPREMMMPIVARLKLIFVEGCLDLDETTAVNWRFPNIKPVKVEELNQEGWGK